MSEIIGNDIYLILDDDIFASERELTNTENADMVETTHKHSAGKRKTYMKGESTGTITCTGLYLVTPGSGEIGYEELKVKYKAGTAVVYEVGYQGAAGVIESGSALVQSLTLTANRNGEATYNVTLQKSGDFTTGTYSS